MLDIAPLKKELENSDSQSSYDIRRFSLDGVFAKRLLGGKLQVISLLPGRIECNDTDCSFLRESNVECSLFPPFLADPSSRLSQS